MTGEELEAAMRDLRALCEFAPSAPVQWVDESVARIAVLAHEAGIKVRDYPTLDQFFAAVKDYGRRKLERQAKSHRNDCAYLASEGYYDCDCEST